MLMLVVVASCGGPEPEGPAQALRGGGDAMAKLKTVSSNLKFTKGAISFRGFALVSAKAALRLPTDSDTVYTVRQQDVQIALEVIIAGGHIYLHLPFSGYNELTGQDAVDIPDLAKLFDATSGLPAIIPDGRNPKYLAAEQIQGVDSHKVEATYSATQIHGMLPQLNSSGDVEAVIWIGGSDHLIRKAVLSGPFRDNRSPSSVEVDMGGFHGTVTLTPPPAFTNQVAGDFPTP